MSGEVAVTGNAMQDFQTKLVERLRKDIGELLPEQVLEDLIKKAVTDEFFKTRIIEEGWNRRREEPSWFVQAVTEAAKPMLEKQVKKFVKENEEVLQKALADFLTPQNLLLLAMQQMHENTVHTMIMGMDALASRINTKVT
jgi:hypothetical protein